MPLITFTENGIETGTRNDILNYLINQFKGIYGGNVYIQEGTEDYNMLLLLADLFNDMGMTATSVSNAFNLTSANGFQLDNLASIFYNRINRNPATSSTVNVVITGTPNTTIVNGQVQDISGIVWNLPSSVTIGNNGQVTVTATCSQTGPYLIQANQITGYNSIVTPVAGWTNVNNPSASTVGQDVESDAAFRYRLAVMAQGNAKSTMQTLASNLLNLKDTQTNTGVYNVQIWENDTSSTISYSTVGLSNIPSHSLAISVYGNISADSSSSDVTQEMVGQIIYNYKSSGVGTYAPSGGTGATSVNVENELGVQQQINFTQAEENIISVAVTLNAISTSAPTDLSGSDTETQIQNDINTFIQNMNIGSLIYANSLYSVVASAITNTLGSNIFNIQSIHLSSTGNDNVSQIQNLYYQKPVTPPANVTITIA